MTQRTNHRQNDIAGHLLATVGLRATAARIPLVLVLVLVLLITTGGAG
ncbi:MAG TPA: hypothetical protein VLF18_08295 [Tahibacter sp.]|nr:hypothetical protein [Tahibacter sp.]HSX60183.1 hypothetical protein [Tahibacter sp.]